MLTTEADLASQLPEDTKAVIDENLRSRINKHSGELSEIYEQLRDLINTYNDKQKINIEDFPQLKALTGHDGKALFTTPYSSLPRPASPDRIIRMDMPGGGTPTLSTPPVAMTPPSAAPSPGVPPDSPVSAPLPQTISPAPLSSSASPPLSATPFQSGASPVVPQTATYPTSSTPGASSASTVNATTISDERKRALAQLTNLLTTSYAMLPTAIAEEKDKARALDEQMNSEGKLNPGDLHRAIVINHYIDQAEKAINDSIAKLHPPLSQSDLAYLNQQTSDFFKKCPLNNNGRLKIQSPHINEDIRNQVNSGLPVNPTQAEPMASSLLDSALPLPPHTVPIQAPPQAASSPPVLTGGSHIEGTPRFANNPAGHHTSEEIIKNMARILSPNSGIKIVSEANHTNPNKKKIICSNNDKSIEFEATPNEVKGKANTETMKLMAAAIVANLEIRIRDPSLDIPDAKKLSIKIDASMPADKAAEFEQMIKAEMKNMHNRNASSSKFNALRNLQVINPHPTAAAASITGAPTSPVPGP